MDETKVETKVETCNSNSCSISLNTNQNIQEQVEIDLYNDEKQQYEDVDIEDKTQWSNIIIDNTVNNQIRLKVLQKYFEDRENDTIEIINKITGIYQFSGSKLIENFLFLIAVESNLSSFLKLECAKSLLSFEEMEEGSDSDDDQDLANIKRESDIEVKERNENRKKLGFYVLDTVCHSMSDMPTPCCIEAVFILMTTPDYTEQCIGYICSLLSDDEIDCDYRYKIILSLEKQDKIKNKELYLYNSLFCFLLFPKNTTMYRILAAQYLLQKITLEEQDIQDIENIIFTFASDNELDYDRRADAADLLLQLGSPLMKIKGREIINHLAQLKGIVRTIFDNAQNVHNVEIENSVMHILEFLADFPIKKINNQEIDFNYIDSNIQKTLKEMRNLPHLEIELSEIKGNCEYCNSPLQFPFEILNKKFCCDICHNNYLKEDNIKVSLNRIYMDRLLYSKFNLTLNHILVKVYSYIMVQDNQEEMHKRLLEELQEMSGTCSSGFASRLVNVISGFGEFNIRISFTDQIISNFAGRLNARIKKISEPDSIFLSVRLNDMIELHILSNSELHTTLKNNIKEKTGKEPTTNLDIINEFLIENRTEKINNCLDDFQFNVLNELTIDSSNFNERKNFLLFLRSNISSIQTELYDEFREYVSDTDFDLAFRRSIYNYEGCNY
jgi:hypothetical protein